ncbi:MAG: hypothetical protein IT301_16380 [Dehalococcoidia bacterium]|nr:hypothetical protein [Dehalococcoidia bacterium]
MVKKMKSPRRLAALAVFAIIAVSAFGFAATNTMPGANRAGTGTDAVSGYVVTNIHYVLNSSGDAATAVEFTLNGPASTVVATMSAANNATVASNPCTNITGNSWSCGFGSPVSIGADFTTLGVNAAQ